MNLNEIIQAEISQLVNDRDTIKDIAGKQGSKDLRVGEKEDFAINILRNLLIKIGEYNDNSCG